VRILAIDVGTGTQDILLWDTEQPIENGIKLVMPSPTAIAAGQIRAATDDRAPLLLVGTTAGGGPSMWAVEDHLRAGLPVFAERVAALSFDDDLTKIEALGVRIVGNAVEAPPACRTVVMGDLHLGAIQVSLRAFHQNPEWDALAVAVFDHGAAPPDMSDRQFRFAHLAETVEARNDLRAFAYAGDAIPSHLTRMAAVAAAAPAGVPLVVMDTGPAAILGARDDPAVADERTRLAVNVGNFHTLAFAIEEERIVGIFEHHTGELTVARLERYLAQLGDGTISNDEVFHNRGHGAVVWPRGGPPPAFRAVTGPRRRLLRVGSGAYYAAPYGDMMLAGCFGLLHAAADHLPASAGTALAEALSK